MSKVEREERGRKEGGGAGEMEKRDRRGREERGKRNEGGKKEGGAQVRGSCAFDRPCQVMETYEEITSTKRTENEIQERRD